VLVASEARIKYLTQNPPDDFNLLRNLIYDYSLLQNTWDNKLLRMPAVLKQTIQHISPSPLLYGHMKTITLSGQYFELLFSDQKQVWKPERNQIELH
jgi:hypothetical protein